MSQLCRTNVAFLAWRNKKGALSLPSLNGKTDHDEKDISTLRSEAPQQARLPQAHVYGQRPQRFERTSPQGTQEVVRELGAPSQRHRALNNSILQPSAAKGNPTGFPFFVPRLSCVMPMRTWTEGSKDRVNDPTPTTPGLPSRPRCHSKRAHALDH